MLRNILSKQSSSSFFLPAAAKSLKHRSLLTNFLLLNFCSLTQNQKKRNPNFSAKGTISPNQNQHDNNKKKTYSPASASASKTEKNSTTPIEYIFSSIFHKFNQSLTDGKSLQQYNAQSLDSTITTLWNSYIGIKKIVDTTRQSNTKENENLKFADLGNVNIYLPNSLGKKNETSKSFQVMMEKITQFLEKNEANILNDLSPFVQLVKSLAKFEQVQDYLPFWELYDRVLAQVLEKYQNPTPENMNNIVSLLKHYSTRGYYLNLETRRNPSNFLLRNILADTQAVEENYLNFIFKNIHSCSLKGLMSLMVQYQHTESRLVSPLYSHIQTLLKKDYKDVNEVVQSINKTQKFRKIPEFANLYISMRDLIMKYAHRGQLRVPEISTALWSIGGDGNPQEKEKNFEILWNLLEHNVKTLKHDDFNIFHVSYLFKTLTMHSHFFNHQRFTFLEETALLAYDNLKNLQEKNRAQIPPSLIASSSHTLLEIYATYDGITSINPLLFSRMAEVLNQVNEGNKSPQADLIFSSAKLAKKLSKNLKDPEMQRNLFEQARKIVQSFVQHFVNRIELASYTDVIKVFDSLCELNLVDSSLYSVFQKVLLEKSTALSLYNCIVVLSNLHSLDQRKFTSEGEPINTTPLRAAIEAQRARVLNNPKKTKLETFESIAYVFTSLAGHNAIQFIVKDFEEQLPEFASQLRFDKLAGLILQLAHTNPETGGLSEETFKKLKPTLIDKIEQGDAKSIHQLVKACIDSHLADPDLFKVIEKALLEKLEKYRSDDFISSQNLANIFGDLAKCYIEDKNLIAKFEEIFQKNVRKLRLHETLQVLNALGTYLSQNIPLIKEVLSVLDKSLQNQENNAKFNFSKPTALTQNFQMAIYTIELEYNKQISLTEYSKVLEMHKKLNDHMELIRYRKPSISIYQRNIVNNLKALKINFEEEYPIGVYLVDFFLKPKKILEVNGPKHYRYGTKELVWRYAKKVRQLEKLGYQVIILPYFDWTHYDFSELKFPFLKNLLQLESEPKEN